MGDDIQVRGARTHNLRSIDIDIPRGKLVVFTGVSGSGKSSLVFDTLCAEGQRRYIESLSPFVRQYLDQLPRPDVDSIDGLPPTLAVAQSGLERARHPRSTVATLTEIHDYLRLLYSRAGDVYCPRCGQPLGQQSVDEIIAAITSLPEGSRLHLLAPLIRGKKGAHQEALDRIRREGFVRARIDGQIVGIDDLPVIDPSRPHEIEMVVDRQIVRADQRARLSESITTALRFGQGTLLVSHSLSATQTPTDLVFNTRLACIDCGISIHDLEPRTFSFNSPYGACPDCQGLGMVQEISREKVVPDPNRSLADGALAPFQTTNGQTSTKLLRDLQAWAEGRDFQLIPYKTLSETQKEQLWSGTPNFVGIEARLRSALHSDDPSALEWALAYTDDANCPSCHGQRLGPEGRSVKVGSQTLPTLLSRTISQARTDLAGLSIRSDRAELARPLVEEVQRRLSFLDRVGVGYIALDRPVWTLSGGEAQRIRLASAVGSGLQGVCYILDEPTMGLHARDTARLLDVIGELRQQGSTVLVVEHDEQAMERADWIVDLGPGAGRQGGEVVAQGTPDHFKTAQSITRDYWTGQTRIERPSTERIIPAHADAILLEGVTHRNLQEQTVRIPLGQLVAITGVSGSGKSTLILDVLLPSLREKLRGSSVTSHCQQITGWEAIKGVVEVDQRPIGRTPRSCPATFVEIMDPIRRVFAQSKEAKLRGYSAGRFSFNNKEGRCPECEGLGARRVEIAFLPETYAACRTCRGKRFHRQTLSLRFKGKSIGDVLDMTVREALEFFVNHSAIARSLTTLVSVGLDYLSLGQWATTLSGGEAQRLKLAKELARPKAEPTLYVLDEPTTGLHFQDVDRLLQLLSRLVAEGHSVIVIEHHLDLIAAADWVIDLGPEGGAEGGQIVAEGTPMEVSSRGKGATAAALARRKQPHLRTPAKEGFNP
ncbi:excinuclease ABC subunit UvrA [bacterium]|nr:excinuclease ABC subunit UvrA [bacterium]